MAILPMGSALEQAVVNAIAAAGLGYSEAGGTIANTFDGRPPPACGQVFVAVWSDGARDSRQRGALEEVVGVKVTVTLRLSSAPFDRWILVRRDLEVRLNAIRALVHRDSLTHAIINAAAVLADLEPSTGGAPTKRVGYRAGLGFLNFDPWQEVGGDWFHAKGIAAGIAQTANFGGAVRVQAKSTMG